MNANEIKFRILFVTGIVSPFWVELAAEINRDADFHFHIAFSLPTLGERGNHWKSFSANSVLYEVIPAAQDAESWLGGVFDTFRPTVAILGGVFSRHARVAAKLCRHHGIPFGYFGEQPNISARFLQRLKLLRYRHELHSKKPDFLLAAGDRATDLYNNLVPPCCKVVFYPYYQDHSASFSIEKRSFAGPIRFLFSGRLIPRNSIKQLTLAFEELARLREGQFRWCISARGEEESFVRNVLSRCEALHKVTVFDRDFKEWSDRLRPFATSDVLVVPAVHSGWGLVVPEAMAVGLAVIATREVEAARFFVEEMVNGLFVKPEKDSILEALIFCVDHPETVYEMGKNSCKAAVRGDVTVGAERFRRLISRWYGTRGCVEPANGRG